MDRSCRTDTQYSDDGNLQYENFASVLDVLLVAGTVLQSCRSHELQVWVGRVGGLLQFPLSMDTNIYGELEAHHGFASSVVIHRYHRKERSCKNVDRAINRFPYRHSQHLCTLFYHNQHTQQDVVHSQQDRQVVYQQSPSLSREKASEMDPVLWTDPAVEREVADEAGRIKELMEVIRRVRGRR